MRKEIDIDSVGVGDYFMVPVSGNTYTVTQVDNGWVDIIGVNQIKIRIHVMDVARSNSKIYREIP